jgi:hypothetical protein
MLSESEQRLRSQIAAHESWAHTEDRAARTLPARLAMFEKFEREVDPEGRLSVRERAVRAEHARLAHYRRMALKSAQVRRRNAGG